MVFRIVSVIALLGLAGRLTYLRFRHDTMAAGAQTGSLSWHAYFRWLGGGLSSLGRPEGWAWLRAAYAYFCSSYPTPFLRWVFIALSSSVIYLALSGFLFAIFSPRGLYGLPLVLHVIAGGIFAAALAANTVLRAKEYTSVIEVFTSGVRPMAYLIGLFSRPLRESVLYWVSVASGLALLVTALFSMLPYFSLRTQLGLVEVHRWSGLALALSAIAFLDSILPRKPE
jgi:hypothetical protein